MFDYFKKKKYNEFKHAVKEYVDQYNSVLFYTELTTAKDNDCFKMYYIHKNEIVIFNKKRTDNLIVEKVFITEDLNDFKMYSSKKDNINFINTLKKKAEKLQADEILLYIPKVFTDAIVQHYGFKHSEMMNIYEMILNTPSLFTNNVKEIIEMEDYISLDVDRITIA